MAVIFPQEAPRDLMAEWREAVRTADDPGQHRALARGEVGRALAEIRPAGALNAIEARPEKDAVHIKFEDLVLGFRGLDAARGGVEPEAEAQHLLDVGQRRRRLVQELARHRFRGGQHDGESGFRTKSRI